MLAAPMPSQLREVGEERGGKEREERGGEGKREARGCETVCG